MEGSTALVVVIGSLFVGITLLLTFGYLNTEKERARQAEAREAESARLAVARSAAFEFFAPPPPEVPAPSRLVFDDALLNRLENHVRLEQTLVAQFVHHPSIDNLYRRAGTPIQTH